MFGVRIYKTQEAVDYPRYVDTMQAGRMLVLVHIYGAGPGNEPGFWWRDMHRVDVNVTCGALFGPVFEQYDLVSVVSPEGFVHHLTRDTNLNHVLRRLHMHTFVDIWAGYRED